MREVFVTDGISPATPAIMESLHNCGCLVHVGESFRYCASFYSKYCHHKYVYPDPAVESERFIDSLLNYLAKKKIRYLIPVRSCSMEAILKSRASIEEAGIKTLLPEYSNWLVGENKHLTMRLAQKLEIPIPQTVFAKDTSFDELVSDLSIPFIIKASKSSGARGIFRIYDRSDYDTVREHLVASRKEFVYQEIIPQPGRSFNASYLYDKDNKLTAWFLMEKIRQYPLCGGSTSYARSKYYRDLLETGRKLLDAMDWKGVAEIEFIQDPRDRVFKLLEINPRFWNPLLLAVKAGVDYPEMVLSILEGKDVISFPHYKTDIGFTFFPYELINLVSGSNLNVIRDFFFRKNNYDNFLKFYDLGLFWGMFVQISYLAFSKNQVLKRGY